MGSPARPSEAVARRLIEEVFSGGRLELIDELVAEDAVEHEELPISTGDIRSDLRAWLAEYRRAFPDLHVEIEDLVVEDDKVVALERITGTNLGSFLGVPPTGRRMSIQGVDILRVDRGRVVEHWGVSDSWTMVRQLGLGTV